MKWYDVTSRTANLKINYDYLDDNYFLYDYTTSTAWSRTSSRVSVTITDFSSSNVDMGTASEAAWDNMFGVDADFVLGIILYTPSTTVYENATHRKYVMVHEIGHALGLGHPNKYYYVTDDASVMRQGTIESYYLPQTHDLNDLNSKY